jgi:GNAT superfamily N-acetyltransferase
VAGVEIVLLSEHPQHVERARTLLEQYVRLPDAWERWGGVPTDLPAFFREELAAFPGAARPPTGDVVLALLGTRVLGVGLVAPAHDDACEFKRVFVQEEFRRRGVGDRLADSMIDRAAALGYGRAVIDVVPERHGAIAFWQGRGFTPCAPYREYPFEMVFMERPLAPRR